MATTTVVNFMKKTAEDRLLREELEALLGVGDGDISSVTELDNEESAALKGEQAPKVAEFAAKYGFDFSPADLVKVVDAVESVLAGKMTDAEFESQIGTAAPKSNGPMGKFMRFMSRTYLGY